MNQGASPGPAWLIPGSVDDGEYRNEIKYLVVFTVSIAYMDVVLSGLDQPSTQPGVLRVIRMRQSTWNTDRGL